jgi:hypothetical protein
MNLRDDFDLVQLRAELRKMTDVKRSQQGEAPDCFRVADHSPTNKKLAGKLVSVASAQSIRS